MGLLNGEQKDAEHMTPANDNKPYWRPGMLAPVGYYVSRMYPDMIFRQREDFSSMPADISLRYRRQRFICENVTADPYASEGKKLTSEDAARYGSAAWSGRWLDYFDWKSSVGLSWWVEQERLYPAPADEAMADAA